MDYTGQRKRDGGSEVERAKKTRFFGTIVMAANVVLLLALVATLTFGTPPTASTAKAAVLVALGMVTMLAIFGAIVSVWPHRIVERRAKIVGELKPAHIVDAENNVRMSLIQAFSGVLLALGFVITWLQLGQAREQFNEAQAQANRQIAQNGDQLRIARSGQNAERFSRAMDQLGDASPDVRIGGIYALESLLIELDDEATAGAPAANTTGETTRVADRQAIIEVVAAYVRNHAHIESKEGDGTSNLGGRAADIQAAMKVLSRRAQTVTSTPIFLARTDLSGLRLTCRSPEDSDCAHLDHIDFTECNLNEADLFASTLEGTDFSSASLIGARLGKAQLSDATLHGTHLENTDLNGADLTDAKLQGAVFAAPKDSQSRPATLDQANLSGAQLQDSVLAGVDLSTVLNLDQAVLDGARADKYTKWPPGFDWRSHGVILA